MSFPHTLAGNEFSLHAAQKESTRRRWFELTLVMFIAFAGPLVRAISYFRNGSAATGQFGNLRYLDSIFHELGLLLLLAYLLWRSGRSFRDIGFRLSFKDAGAGILLLIASYILYGIGSSAIFLGYHAIYGNFPAHVDPRKVFGQMPWMALPFTLLNGFFEELLVRAYLMTEIRELTGSIALASIASIVIQTSYHIYYGWVGMFSVAFLFVAFTIFFAIRRRSMPLVVAHGLVDLLGYIRLR